jgi:hypothetical protein
VSTSLGTGLDLSGARPPAILERPVPEETAEDDEPSPHPEVDRSEQPRADLPPREGDRGGKAAVPGQRPDRDPGEQRDLVRCAAGSGRGRREGDRPEGDRERIQRRRRDRGEERTPDRDDVLRRLEAEAGAESGADGANSENDEHGTARDAERETEAADPHQLSGSGEPEGRVEDVDRGDRRGHREPDEQRTPTTEDRANDEQRDRADLRREEQSDAEAAEKNRSQRA